MLKKSILVFLKSNLSLIVLLIFGVISWSLTMVKSGLCWNAQCASGVGFWGANGHDGIWHLALINNLSKGIFDMPVFAGYTLQNYHIGFDLLVAMLHRLTGISINTLYFQILPPIFTLLIGLFVYWFIENWRKSKKEAVWAVFFTYFAGSFGWVLGKGESAFWSQQAITSLINPPFALSLIFILLGLIFLLKFLKNHSTYYFLLSTVFFGLLIEIKVYAGLLVLGALFVSAVHELITVHPALPAGRRLRITFVFLGSLTISLILFFSLTRISGSSLVWQPFWFLETMMGISDRLGWTRFYSAMMTYKSGGILLKGTLAYLVAFVIFVVGNFGTRILAFKNINLKKLSSIDLFIWSIITGGILIPTFFLQKGTPWNTIQFFYYSLFFSGILAGIVLSRTTYYILLATVLLTIPTTIITLKDVYLPQRPPAILPKEELSALEFLRNQPDGVVLTYPFDRIKAKEAEASPPRPLYLYESTAYVSAFSGKSTFLEDEVNLNITGYDWPTRRVDIENWYKEPNEVKARKFLKKNSIKYIYWVKPQRAYLGEGQLGLIRLFENLKVDIWMVGD
ncbi:MAG: hypothetical protein NTV24_01615 [Candidatus Woesebacteria bacterium]|nr:hypothetical protein [Candidatus Woesebacteria bacterium]